jgi:hypothetical protein
MRMWKKNSEDAEQKLNDVQRLAQQTETRWFETLKVLNEQNSKETSFLSNSSPYCSSVALRC